MRELRREGWSIDRISVELNLPRKQVQTVCTHMTRDVSALTLDAPPVLAPDATPRHQAEAHARWLKEQIDKAVKDGVPAKEVAALSGQYVNAVRLAARLSGSLEVTAAQIVRSIDFQRAVTALQRAIGDNHEVWAKWETELTALIGDGA